MKIKGRNFRKVYQRLHKPFIHNYFCATIKGKFSSVIYRNHNWLVYGKSDITYKGNSLITRDEPYLRYMESYIR